MLKSASRTSLSASPYIATMRCIVMISAYLHDIGKISQQFQEKILKRGTPLGEYARHELISCIIFNRILVRLSDLGMSEQEMLCHLSSPAELAEAFEHALSEPLFHSQKHDDVFEEMMVIDDSDVYPRLCSIIFLITSHHKLPEGRIASLGKEITLNKHINNSATEEDLLDKNKTIAPNKYLFLTDPESDYIAGLASGFGALGQVEDGIDSLCLMTLVPFYGRLSLISGDHVVSSQAYLYASNKAKDEFYANSIRSIATKGKKIPAQTLREHLGLVASQSADHFDKVIEWIQRSALPSIPSNVIPDPLRPSGATQDSKFYWQDHMIKLLHEKHAEGIKSSGFFGVLIAGTGSGKTRANAKIIVSVSDEVRYTLAVGLRTLTLQTQTEYRQDVGFNEGDVGMLIGSEISKRLYEINQAEKVAQDPLVGSSLTEEPDLPGTFAENYPVDGLQDAPLVSILKPKEQSMLLYPVVVCTVDHVIRVADMTKGHHIAASLRAMTSDLVLDEVDSYSDIDLISIGKLVYRTGMAGRRVVISSATVNPDVVEMLYESYQNGYAAYCRMIGKPCNIFAGWFSEYADINHVDAVADGADFQLRHAQFVANLSQRLALSEPRRKGAILPVESFSSEEEAMDGVLEACRSLHHQHHSVCPTTGVRLSCGMVRWNTVRKSIGFTQHLLMARSQHVLRVLCYHSKQMPYVLDVHSEFLNELVKRKDKGAVAIFNHPMVQDAIRECHEDGIQDIMFVMSTTSIEEVGRDHDFDYAISEPSSYRSMIQLAGRVKRHRVMTCHTPNMLIMQRPFDRLLGREGKKPKPLWALKKDILSKMSDLQEGKRLSERPGEAWDATLANEALAFMGHDALSIIDARTCLQGTAQPRHTSPLSLYEFGKRELALAGSITREVGDTPHAVSLKRYINDPHCHFNDFHYNNNPFRASQPSQLFFRDEHGHWMRMWEDGSEHDAVSADESVRALSAYDPYGRMAIKGDYRQRLEEIIMKLGIQDDAEMKASLQSVSVMVGEKGDANFTVQYHEALGMIKEIRRSS